MLTDRLNTCSGNTLYIESTIKFTWESKIWKYWQQKILKKKNELFCIPFDVNSEVYSMPINNTKYSDIS